MKSPQKPATSTQRPGGASVVKLSVHKNTMAKRRSADLRDTLVQAAKDHHSNGYLSGYVVVFIDAEGKLAIEIERGKMPPHHLLPLIADALHTYASADIVKEVADGDDGEQEEDQQS